METYTTYIPPEILQVIDDDDIHARMLEALPSDIDKTEGGFAHDFTRPAALEKASMMVDLNETIQMFFPAWSYGTWLDQIAASVGLQRRTASAAQGYLTVTGAEGKTIPAGYLFATPADEDTPNIEYAVVDSVVIGDTLTAQVKVRCTEAGTIGNAPANSITLMVSPMGGIMTITNESAFTDGMEEETDDTLRERIRERDLSNESSFVGNIGDYKRWAKEVTGVGDVVVLPEWEGVGTGTVKLVIMDSNGSPASAAILEDVYNHIMAPDDEDARLAPIGSILTVVTATLVPISVSASVALDDEADIENVIDAFTAAFKLYFEEANDEGFVRYTRVGSILSETEGVLDYTNLLINGSTANIPIDADEYPGIGTIALVVGT